MKKLIFIAILASTSLLADQSIKKEEYKENPFLKEDNFPGGYSLSSYSMPPLIGIYMMSGGQKLLKTSEKQHKIFEERFKVMFDTFHKTAKEIRTLETQLMEKVVYEGADEIDVKNLIDLIKEKKTKLTVMQITCINYFKKNLNEEKYKQLLKTTKEKLKSRRLNESKK